MVSLDDIKNTVGTEWTKLGATTNGPNLSIFPVSINQGLAELNPIPNKTYFFDDETHNYKMDVSVENNKNKYTFFIKGQSVKQPEKAKPKQAAGNIPEIVDVGTMAYVILAVSGIVLLLLTGAILKIFFG